MVIIMEKLQKKEWQKPQIKNLDSFETNNTPNGTGFDGLNFYSTVS